jgi:ubiquinone/menaquinone biosynthesis C-methylase UbiE
LEPREELSLREKIPRLSPATDDISLAVASMYEENPYPRWKRLAPSPPEGHSFRRILIAGCGSGREAILMGKAFPGADIVAIDLSLSSLAQSMRRCGDFGVGNIRFFHCDLLEAHRLGQSFDHIACSGVLHHLRRPEYGLRALAGILDDGGLMRLELYRKGRRESIAAAIEMREQLGLEPTLGGIRALRAAIRALPPDHPAASVASEGDFFTASGCRDLLFHVQEHRYTLLDIDGLLHAAGMRLAAVKCGGDGIASKFHTRVPGSTRADLEAWDAFERARPGVHFGPMYRLLISR